MGTAITDLKPPFSGTSSVAPEVGHFLLFPAPHGGEFVAFCALLKLIPTYVPGWDGSGFTLTGALLETCHSYTHTLSFFSASLRFLCCSILGQTIRKVMGVGKNKKINMQERNIVQRRRKENNYCTVNCTVELTN